MLLKKCRSSKTFIMWGTVGTCNDTCHMIKSDITDIPQQCIVSEYLHSDQNIWTLIVIFQTLYKLNWDNATIAFLAGLLQYHTKAYCTWNIDITAGAVHHDLPLWASTGGTRRVQQTHEVATHPQTGIGDCVNIIREYYCRRISLLIHPGIQGWK